MYTKESQLNQSKKKNKKGFGSRPNNGNFGRVKKAIKAKAAKAKKTDVIDVEFMNWKRSLYGDNHHIHHIEGRIGKELGETRNDYVTVALPPQMHSIGEKSYHSTTEKDFLEFWEIDLEAIGFDSIKEYWHFVAYEEQQLYIKQGGIVKDEHIIKRKEKI